MRAEPPQPPAPAPAGPWTRPDWLRLADLLLDSARRFASPGHARITPPGTEGGYGTAVDGLEGFARTFLLAGLRIAGEHCAGLDELADWYAAGIAAGSDPASPERWVRLDEHPQAKVEAAAIALTLDLTRPWIWDRLTPAVRERVVQYLAPAVGDPTYPRINWVWFRLVVQTFLRSVGGPWSADDIAEDLATHDTFHRADGWLSDGPERAYDHYTGWALHLYPTLWARMSGAADLAATRRERDRAALDRYLHDALALVGADGSPLIQGRSLTYRFAAAAPFWAGALAEVPSHTPGQLRHAATRIVAHFTERGAPDERGLLTIGWHAPWPRLAQAYTGPGSPYWASKGLLGICLPAHHPVWTAPAQPLPVHSADSVRAVRAPGWLVCATRADGIVRVVNHGTDHATAGSDIGDSPLYARLGYSTATAPLLDEAGWSGPGDQCVCVLDEHGRATHRSGMRTLTLRVDDGPACGDGAPLGVAGSTTLAHWVDPDPAWRDHGGGRPGRSRPAGRLTVYSLVRGAWELRLTRIDDTAAGLDPGTLRLRIAGWPVAGDGATEAAPDRATATGARLTSHLRDVPIDGAAHDAVLAANASGVAVHRDAGPLGDPVRVPWLEYPLRPGVWALALLELSGSESRPQHGPCHATFEPADQDPVNQNTAGQDTADPAPGIRVTWPDGRSTHTPLSTRTRRGSRSGDPAAIRAR